jgi:uncharacterized protein YegP (UPF0339 family)
MQKKEKLVFELYVDTDKQFRWRLWAPNERKIANSGEGYHNKADCMHAINLIKENASDAEIQDKTQPKS